MDPQRTAVKRERRAIAVALAATLVGCATHSPVTDVEPQVELPESFSQGRSGIEMPERWWRAFRDPDLERVVEEALADNLSLRMAWARLEQMHAVARAAGAARYPGLDLTLGAEHTRFEGDQPAPPFGPAGDTEDTLTAGLGLSYQVDLWRKIGNARRAEVLAAQAGRQDVEATALAVSGAAVELWYSIAAQRATVALLEAQIEVGQEYLDLVEVRFANGLASAMDVYRQRLQVENTRSQAPVARTRLSLLEQQLALLLGKPPRSAAPHPVAGLPALPPLPATGVPAEVLRARPDVRAAELRLVAADHRLAVAVADRLPALTLSATAGSQADSFGDLLDAWFVSLAGNLIAPLFDGGRREAEADRNRAVVQESFHAWQSSLILACHEVEDALVSERGLLERQRILDTQLDVARSTLERSRARYVNGLTDYLNVLTSLQSLQELERARIGTRSDLLINRITLHLALGGTWAAELIPPPAARASS